MSLLLLLLLHSKMSFYSHTLVRKYVIQDPRQLATDTEMASVQVVIVLKGFVCI